MTARPANQNDLPFLTAILKRVVANMAEKNIRQWDQTYPTASQFLEDLRNRSLFVLADPVSDQPQASICLNQDQEPEYDQISWTQTQDPVLVVHRLMVDPQTEGKGLGRALMAFTERHALKLGITSVRLDSFSQNKRALRFYKDLGYQQAGTFFFPHRKDPFMSFEKRLILDPGGL